MSSRRSRTSAVERTWNTYASQGQILAFSADILSTKVFETIQGAPSARGSGSSSKEGSYVRLIDLCITQLWAGE